MKKYLSIILIITGMFFISIGYVNAMYTHIYQVYLHMSGPNTVIVCIGGYLYFKDKHGNYIPVYYGNNQIRRCDNPNCPYYRSNNSNDEKSHQ